MRLRRSFGIALTCASALACSALFDASELQENVGAGAGGGASADSAAEASVSGGSAGLAGAGAGGTDAGWPDSAGGAAGAGGFSVSGSVEIVNPGTGTKTSVILVDSAFSALAVELEPPPGPKATDVTGAWTIPNVPPGPYRVLVAWENDGLVVDPDRSIAGGQLREIVVVDHDVVIPESVKVTGAVEIVGPDNGETVAGGLVFEWLDDASEDSYDLVLTDESGNKVWTATAPAVSGPLNVTAQYDGPALAPGIYRWQVTATRNKLPITHSEDLRGVFSRN